MTARDITTTLAPVLEGLELEQPRVVSTADMDRYRRKAGVSWQTSLVIQRLRERGWLLDLKTRGVWEFAPAARAGTHDAGDHLIELRASLLRRPDLPIAVAAESAAWLLGYTSRPPSREAVGMPTGMHMSPALREYRRVTWEPRLPTVERDGLPVWVSATLLGAMSIRPSSYRDWPNVGEWLSHAAGDIEAEDLLHELAGHLRSAWMRAAYLMDFAGREDVAAQVMREAPTGSGPYYLGDRGRPGAYSSAYDVVDTSGLAATLP